MRTRRILTVPAAEGLVSDVDQAIADTDRWIGQLASADRAGVWEDTNFS